MHYRQIIQGNRRFRTLIPNDVLVRFWQRQQRRACNTSYCRLLNLDDAYANICMYADSYPRIELNIWLSKLLQNIKLIRIYTVLVFVISCTTNRLRLFLCYLAYAHIQSEMPVGLVLFLTRKNIYI
jgi:hypothetical protein